MHTEDAEQLFLDETRAAGIVVADKPGEVQK